MKVIAINGSSRKDRNTAQMLNTALEGAASAGADTELVHLVDLDFSGCMSCFGCKRLGNPNFGKCNLKDGLAPVLEKISRCGALIIGSPIYIGDVTGMTRNLIERLTFQYISYDNTPPYFDGHINCAFIYTMNCPKEFSDCQKAAYEQNAECLKVLGGTTEYIMANETWQWDDYSKYASGMFDAEAKRRYHEKVWPLELQNAFELGRKLASK